MSGRQENGHSETTMYDPDILRQLDSSKFKGEYKDGVKPLAPGNSLVIRPLSLEDYEKGYLDLMAQLTTVGDLSQEVFSTRFNEMKACKDTYYVTVIEDTSTGKVIGSATLVKEQKFIHSASARGRVEDVVVNSDYRGKQLGKVLVDVLVNLSEQVGCYKVSLECKEDKVKFYSLFGFSTSSDQNYMQQRFFD